MPPRRRPILIGNVRIDRAARAAARASRQTISCSFPHSITHSLSDSDMDQDNNPVSLTSSFDKTVPIDILQREIELLRRENDLLRRERDFELLNVQLTASQSPCDLR